jgi:outer membrane protein assembly factor BamB
VTVYAAGANGNAVPIRTISGSKTGLSIPAGVALDGNGNVYVADPTTNNAVYAVTVYAASASGNVAPIRTISGSKTGLNTPVGVALDSGGNIYALNHNPPESVKVYAVSANGNVSPIRAIRGSNTGLNSPAGIAVHSACSK